MNNFTGTGNEVEVDASPVKPEEDPCLAAKIECQTMRCPYLVDKYVDSDLCEKCRCHDPCREQICPEDTQCAVDLFQNPRTRETEFRAACRPSKLNHFNSKWKSGKIHILNSMVV